MRTTRSRLLTWAIFGTVLSAIHLPEPLVNAQTQKIRIAYSSRSNTVTPFYIAASKGFFREEGLEVELIQVSPRLGAMAVMNGDVSFTTSFTSTFRGILQGLPLKLVLVALKKGIYYLVVRPEIKDVQDLKGKNWEWRRYAEPISWSPRNCSARKGSIRPYCSISSLARRR